MSHCFHLKDDDKSIGVRLYIYFLMITINNLVTFLHKHQILLVTANGAIVKEHFTFQGRF